MPPELIHIDGIQWALRANGYSERLRQASKLIPGMRWDANNKYWSGPIDAIMVVCKILDIAPVPQ